MLTLSIFYSLLANTQYLINYFILILISLTLISLINLNNWTLSKLLWNGYGNYDGVTHSILLISGLIAIIIILNYWEYLNDIKIKLNNEYLILIILTLIGMAGLAQTNSNITLLVAIELQSLTLYILLATNVVTNLLMNTSKVSLSYLINAAMATSLLLLGLSINNSVIILIAVLWKLGVVPVHVWSLPILDNQHSLTVQIYLTIAKYGILLTIALIGSSSKLAIETLIYVGLLNLTLGNLLGILQIRYQRIIVYSSLIQIGYILLALSNFNSLGLGYFELYSFYTVMLLILWTIPTYNIYNNASLFSNFNRLIMILVLYTVAGLPFFPLFWTKLDVFLIIQNSSLIIALISTLLSSLIYVRLIKYMSFYKTAL